MKVFISVLLCLFCWAACTPRQQTVAYASQENVTWEGKYLFENDGGEAGKWLLGNTYTLTLGENPELEVAGYSMGSPHGRWQVELEKEGKNLVVKVKSWERGRAKDWKNIPVGAELFRLVQGAELRTEWKMLKPVYGDLPAEGVYFQLQK